MHFYVANFVSVDEFWHDKRKWELGIRIDYDIHACQLTANHFFE